MSPEQISGACGVVDHRTDIYSLGVTLYELATHVPAFPGEDRYDLTRRIAGEEPIPARRLVPQLPLDFETIIK
jgi:serine/threonine protein kinase